MRVSRMAYAAAVALFAGTPAAAQTTNDAKCLMASNLFSKAAKDPKARALGDAGKYFYLGRITGRLTEQQVRAQMVAQTKTITAANAGSVMSACAKQMEGGAAMVERVGKLLAPQKK